MGLGRVPRLFRAGFVFSRRWESKSSRLAAQGAGAELGGPPPAAFLPPELHTPRGSRNARVCQRLSPLQRPSLAGHGSWTSAGAPGGPIPNAGMCPLPKGRAGRGRSRILRVGGTACDTHGHPHRWAGQVPWHRAPRRAGCRNPGCSRVPFCHRLVPSVGHQLQDGDLGGKHISLLPSGATLVSRR